MLRKKEVFEIEFVAVRSDAVTVMNGKEIPLDAGRVIVSTPGDLRNTMFHGDTYRCYFLHLLSVDPALAEALRKLGSTFFVKDPDRYVNRIIHMMRFETHELPDQLEILSDVEWILAHLLKETTLADLPAYRSFLIYKERLEKLKHYIDVHYAEPINLETLCEQSQFSLSYLHRLFYDAFGISPGKYLQNVRLENARVMLITKNDPVSEVARLNGFSSQHYFTGRFKNQYKVSPLKYRQMMRRSIEET